MQNPTITNPLKSILRYTVLLFIVLLIAYSGLKIAQVQDINHTYSDFYENACLDIRVLSNNLFNFIKPFLQLIIVLLVLEWILNKFGFSINQNTLKLDWNTQTIIAVIVVVAFSLASLSGIDGARDLKDIALVVVGFYFGTQRRLNEIVEGDKKTTIIEEHTNERSV